ncbi:MAG: hypothetical protein M0Z64_09105 [Nitrospiraceae bacterium]|nr:hypothetical protein [Nitrospiraceae bacterium]
MKTEIFYTLRIPDPVRGPLIYGNPDWLRKYRFAEWADDVELESITCPVYPGHQRGGKRIGELKIILSSAKIGDFVWTWYSDCLITDRVYKLFKEAGFTGFKVFPVTVKKIKRKAKNVEEGIPRLWELVVTGKGGNAHPDSGIRMFYKCDACGLIKYSSFRNGIIVNKSEWDGSDFFAVNGYSFILVTERVKQFIIEHKFTNCALIPSHELQWGKMTRPEDVYEGEKFGTHP